MSMRNKVWMSLLLVMVLLVAVGCGQQAAEEPAPAPENEEAAPEEAPVADGGIVIGMTANNTGIDSYQTTHDEAFRAEVERHPGVEAIILDATGDPMLQMNQVENLIQQGVDVLVIWPVNGQAIVPAAQQAQEAGIPVIICNSPIDESGYEFVVGFVGPDNVIQGQYAAEMMIEALGGQGKVVELTGLPGYVTATERGQGFHDGVAGTGIEIIDSQPADWNREKAQNVMENLLTSHSDMDGVYAHDDNIAVGALNALREAGKAGEVFITSATMFGDGYDAMKEGLIYGTVYQSPLTDAEFTVQTAVKVAQGEEVEFFNYFPTPKVTVNDIDNYDRPIW